MPRRHSPPKAPSSTSPAGKKNPALQATARVFAAAGEPSAVKSAQGKLSPPAAAAAWPAMPHAVGAARVALSSWAQGDWRHLEKPAWFGSAITYAVAGSLLIHSALLVLRFHGFDPLTMADRGPPLEVSLVNAKSTLKPAKADILAQANLDGGGNTDADRRAKTPLPIPPEKLASDDIAMPARKAQAVDRNDIAMTARKAEALERRARELMTQLKAESAAPAVAESPDVPVVQEPVEAPAEQEPAEAPEPPAPVAIAELTQRTLAAMRLEAQISRDLDAYQKLPRRRHVGVRAEEYRFARYVEDWRQKVERVGNLNYPEAARQLKLYGNLILTVSIRADGSVEKVVIERSSGHRVLDAAATRIVEMASPYSPFPADIRRDTAVLDITRTWTFARGDELRSD